MMMYTAQEIADYVVSKCIKDGCPISNLQLQKILYFLQAGALHAGRGTAFGDEIEAWQFGPVVPGVYYQFSRYGAMPITSSGEVELLPEDRAVLDPIIEEKRAMGAWELVDESHQEGGPWARNYKGPGSRHSIPVSDIEQYG